MIHTPTDRRRLLAGTVMTAAALHSRRGARAATTDLDTAIGAGLAKFRPLAAEQARLCRALLDALHGGDLEAAQRAYLVARPPYEQIELYAAAFEDIDLAIDGRPYHFEGGETNPDFEGFHRIEAQLFRDGDMAAATPVTAALIERVEALQRALEEPARFSAPLAFDGMINLADEVASKKISSEEETWSNRSMMIFRDNWLGIASQYEPYADLVAKESEAAARSVDGALQVALTSLDGHFTGDPVAGPPYDQVPSAERAAIVKASYALRSALLDAREVLRLG
jgi:iron uptake system component EfeO